jgi:hypothetical protein
MSQKRIKRIGGKSNKPFKLNRNSMMEFKYLFGKDKENVEKEKKDIQKIEDLIIEDKLDTNKIEDYKYIKSIAQKLEWPIHKTFKMIGKAKVKEAVKNENLSTQS